MLRAPLLVGTIASLLIVLAPACSSSNSGTAGETCPAGFDAGDSMGGSASASENDQCGNLFTGTKQDGEACQQSSECAPTCCACPSGGHSAQVVLCNAGKCVVGAGVCCAWIARATGDAGPYVCSSH
ncbi:MAG TPA: hypothetical protein VMI75_09425 [Polyangiaceae bacterium]|nr:hypothetical protein [Polyangiaceae bacterium]